jgi:hypothetical protein
VKGPEKLREKAQREKISDRPGGKLSDKNIKERDKVRDKVREKAREKLQDKIKDRDLSPLHATLSTKLLDSSPRVSAESSNTVSEGHAFIVPSERPEVGMAPIEDDTKKAGN